MFELSDNKTASAIIKVIGVGGGGGNAIEHMINEQVDGVEFVCANTDLQVLRNSQAKVLMQLGEELTKGLGAGADPEIGRQAAEENREVIRDILSGTDMVFLTAGMGGGTGTGATPIFAEIAKELGILTVAVVTKPFVFEGRKRITVADEGIKKLTANVDSLITIPNNKLLPVLGKNISLLHAFKAANDVLLGAVQGIAELITKPGLINVDFADVRTIMADAGSALMGMGRGSGENRAVVAAKAAIASPLLDLDVDGAKGILFMITGGRDLGMSEVSEAAKIITGSADDVAKVIFGASIDETMKDEIRITVIATGFGDHKPRPVPKIDNLMFGRSAFAKKQEREEERPKMNAVFESPFKNRPVAPVMKTEPMVPAKDVFEEQVEEDDVPELETASESQEEDLEIPAFLRRKLG